MPREKVLITSALPYANGPLHFGHIAGAYLPGDCYARFQRLMGNHVLYVCGSDEYGVAITLSAEMAKRSPKEHVDIFNKVLQELFHKLEFSFDHYSRTTWPGHVDTVQQFFKDLLANGYIEERITNQLYSEEEKRFLADRYVVGTCPKCGFEQARGDECTRCGANYEATDLIHPRSKLTGSPLILKPTKHWFLLFDRFKDQLAEWLGKKQWKSNVLNFARSYVEDLRPRAITRDSSWGVPIPLDEAKGKVFYVWFDAPIGYISATKEWAQIQKKPDLWKEFWLDPKTKLVQFIGKDNIPFHAVFFPAMIMGQNQPYKLVDELPANEFLNLEGRQFSKSEGWTIDLEDFFHNFTADQIRYYLAANAPENQDAEFSWKDFQQRMNAELVGKLGNFANRTLVFAEQHCQGKVPMMESFNQTDETFLEKIAFLSEEIRHSYEHFQLRKACQHIMELAQAGNVYFDHKKPWALAKDPGLVKEMRTVIACCLEALKVLALALSPIIPKTAQKLWSLLGFKSTLEKANWRLVIEEKIPDGQMLVTPEILFKKVEDEVIEKEIEKLKQRSQMTTTPTETPKAPALTYDEFKKMELRVGQILEAEKIIKSKRLLKLLVDIGTEKRTIVSGISERYPDPAVLIGKKVVVVANLAPAKLMGVESHGMVLAISSEKGLELLEASSANPGDLIS